MSERPSNGTEESAGGYLPVDILLLAFLAATGILVLVSPLTFPGKALYAVAHLAALAAVIGVRFTRPRRGSLGELLRYGYPLLGLPFFYMAMRYLNRLVTTRYFDGPMVRVEGAIFGCQPSQAFHQAMHWLPLSEFLHFAYVAYLLLVPAVGIPLMLQRRSRDLALFSTSVLATYIPCYIAFILFPVRGPYYFFGPIDPVHQGLVFPEIAHWLLQGASSAGSAFPSSHVAAAVSVWILGRRFYPRWGWALLLAAGGIFLGTIYGGFHYALDALAGLLVGIAGGLAGPWLHAWLLSLRRAGAEAPAVAEEQRAAAS